MTPLLSLIFLVLIAYVGALFLHNVKTSSSIFRGITNSGIIYLLLGYIIGPNLLKVLDLQVLNDLSLLIAFVLGWTGFIIGLQINAKQMRRFPISYYWKTLLIFTLNFVFMTLGLLIVKQFIYNRFTLTEIIVLSIAGSISSPLLIGLLKKDYKIRGKLIHFLQFHSAYDNMVSIVIIGIMIFLGNELKNEVPIIIKNMSILLAGATIMAIIFYYIAKDIKSVPQYFLLIIGFILMLVGTAMHMGQSVIFISFLFGMILANLPINTWKLFQTISNTEKPIYLLLLIFIGARLPQSTYMLLLIIIIYSFGRFIIKYISSWIIISKFRELKPNIGIIGLSGIGMGGLSLAFGLDYYLLNNYSFGENVLLILAVAYILNDTFSLKLLEKKIQK
ncbi:MAG: hypothetical protein KAS18_00155 [Calditrichia bacterium]|nr:hypothetical protein [Calditrichia bacterium]